MNSSFERDTAHHIRLLVDHVPSMLAYWDRDLRCRFANRAYEAWFGVDPEGLIGTSLRDLLGPELFRLNEPYVRGALAGEQQVFERVVPGPNGIKRHSLATYIPDAENGEVMGFIAHVTEVTKLKETEEALRTEVAQRDLANARLRASESALREAQRLGHIGSWEWESEPDIHIWSEELYRIFGRDPKRLPPTYAEIASLYTAESWSRLDRAVAQALQSGEPYTLELEYLHPNGDTGWIEAQGEAVRDPRGKIIGLRGTAREITLRRRMDEARIKLLAAEAANKNKTALLSRVSHELRTPLNGILGFAQLCQSDPTLDAKHRGWADVISASGQHMLALVEEMLDLSAAEGGQIAMDCTAVELGTLVRECVRQLSSVAATSGIELVSNELGVSPMLVHADRMRLKQVIDNLLSNAIKYSRAGGVITVSTREVDTTVELTVQDTGSGLSPEQLERIFIPFDRLGAEKTGVRGSGLGLALSKRLVELMGGSIRVSSRLGAGSAFIVTLPSSRGVRAAHP